MPKNHYAKQLVKQKKQIRVSESHAIVQMCKDAASMACNDVFHMGPTRGPLFSERFDHYIKEIAGMTVDDGKDDPELLRVKNQVDTRLKEIYGDHFHPWPVRYAQGDLT